MLFVVVIDDCDFVFIMYISGMIGWLKGVMYLYCLVYVVLMFNVVGLNLNEIDVFLCLLLMFYCVQFVMVVFVMMVGVMFVIQCGFDLVVLFDVIVGECIM